MNGLVLPEQMQPVQWQPQQGFSANPVPKERQEIFSDSARAWRAALLGLNRTPPSHPLEKTAPPTGSPYARPYAAEDVAIPPVASPIVRAVGLGAHRAWIPPGCWGRPAQMVSRPTVRRVPYVDRSREMEWIREHQAEYADMWVAVEGDRMIAADLDAKVVFAALKAAGITRPFVVHLEPSGALPFGGW